jgi:hypothetical protein
LPKRSKERTKAFHSANRRDGFMPSKRQQAHLRRLQKENGSGFYPLP